jgi:NADP-dependent 3-hydroxy acid dehydrogenase YdfG
MAVRTIRGRTVVVTGATSGIGRETALAFARAGARLVVAGRREERLTELVKEIGKDDALAVRTDVADVKQVEALIAQAQKRFKRIDVLVNNAGSAPPRASTSRASTTSAASWTSTSGARSTVARPCCP